MGSNPGTVSWMDTFHIDLLSKLYCLFEKTENKQKDARGWIKKVSFGDLIVQQKKMLMWTKTFLAALLFLL